VITSFAAWPKVAQNYTSAQQHSGGAEWLPSRATARNKNLIYLFKRCRTLKNSCSPQKRQSTKSHAIRFLTMAAAARQTCDKKWTDAAPLSAADQRSLSPGTYAYPYTTIANVRLPAICRTTFDPWMEEPDRVLVKAAYFC
jgi:hypothetical protein